MNLDENFESFIKDVLNKYLPTSREREIYHYPLFPSGKLFRARLIHSIAKDLKIQSNDIKLMAAIIEIHHCYTLIHDDLPAMDDDDQRRGRASVHKKFNEWKAILSGDGLLSISYALATKLNDTPLDLWLKFMGWCCGPKGLISGQYSDLDSVQEEQTLGFNQILRTHELKTARLMQLCCLAPLIVNNQTIYSELKKHLRIGQAIGVGFQLLDDFDEFSNDNLSQQEYSINTFAQFPKDASRKLASCIEVIEHLEMTETKAFVMKYIKTTLQKCDLKKFKQLTKFA